MKILNANLKRSLICFLMGVLFFNSFLFSNTLEGSNSSTFNKKESTFSHLVESKDGYLQYLLNSPYFDSAYDVSDIQEEIAAAIALADTDGDGIPNVDDLDDDNDGILDCDEATSTAVMGDAFGPTFYKVISQASGEPAYDPSVDITKAFDGGLVYNVPGNSWAQWWINAGNGTTLITPNIVLNARFTFPLEKVHKFVLYNDAGGAGNGLKTFDLVLIDEAGTLYTQSFTTSATATSFPFREEFTLSAVRNNIVYMRVIMKTKVDDKALQITEMGLVFSGCVYEDTDGDGVLDKDDEDSDNDGCPDALEAASSTLTYADLDADGSINTTLHPVNSTGQPSSFDNGVGTSTDPSVQAAECDPCNNTSSLFTDNDNDGVGDVCDLDDDNDGILDADENFLCGVTDMTDFLGLSSVSSTPVSQSIPLDGADAGNNVTLTLSNGAGDGVLEVREMADFAIRDLLLGGDGNGLTVNGLINSTENKTAVFEYDLPVYNLNVKLTDLDYGNLNGYEVATINAYLEDGTVVDLSTIDITEYRFDYPGDYITAVNSIDASTIVDNTVDGSMIFAHNVWNYDFSSATTTQGITKLEFIFTGSSTSDNSMNLSIFDLNYCGGTDTDGDGVPDYLDVDSDNDGCPDAIEGSGSITSADLDAGNMIVGPDADGDGVVDGSEQTAGFSADPTANGCNTTLAEDDINQTEVGIPAQGNILTNDGDPEGDTQTVSLIDTDGDGVPDTAPVAGTPVDITKDGVVVGTLELDPATGQYVFTPDPDYPGGEVSIPYEVCDDGNPVACATAELVIDVVNPGTEGYPPFVIDDESITEQGVPVDVNVLANDSDPDGTIDPTSVMLIDPATGNPTTSVTVPGEGTYTVNPDGSIKFTPDPDFTGEATPVTYQACDDNTPTPNCDTADLTITVVGPSTDNTTNAFDDSNSGAVDETLTGNVLTNDVDLDGDDQDVSLIDTDGDGIPDTAPVAGTPTDITQDGVVVGSLTIDPETGEYVWVPTPGFEGTVNIAMDICDDNVDQACDQSTLVLSSLGGGEPDFNPSITVSPINGISGPTPMRVIIDIKEITGNNSTGDLVVLVPKVNFFSFTYDPVATTVGGVPTTNSTWTFSESNTFWIFTRTSTHSGFEINSFGMVGVFEAPAGSTGNINFVVQIFNGSGGDTVTTNNTDYVKIAY